ncbi:hypothetical protein SAMN04488111_2302 [Lutibacter flavus]|uniref:Uncharacterized protein n=1 Tax=Lutibacter flavus TaxID=691689 RepID=A0A238Y5U7_9FLAO|nr:hypothetical protein SAMN04488111_2302 [Lutibacter flavus]
MFGLFKLQALFTPKLNCKHFCHIQLVEISLLKENKLRQAEYDLNI